MFGNFRGQACQHPGANGGVCLNCQQSQLEVRGKAPGWCVNSSSLSKNNNNKTAATATFSLCCCCRGLKSLLLSLAALNGQSLVAKQQQSGWKNEIQKHRKQYFKWIKDQTNFFFLVCVFYGSHNNQPVKQSTSQIWLVSARSAQAISRQGVYIASSCSAARTLRPSEWTSSRKKSFYRRWAPTIGSHSFTRSLNINMWELEAWC